MGSLDSLDAELNRVSDWLKYEEAKNGALVALNGVGAGVILQWLSSTCNATSLLAPWLTGSLAAFLLSIIIALSSFYPVLKGKRLHEHAIQRRCRRLKAGSLSDPNILFFADIAGLQAEEYLGSFRTAAGASEKRSKAESSWSSLELAYAQEIVANSEIAVLKLRLFEIAVVISLVGLVVTCFAALINLIVG